MIVQILTKLSLVGDQFLKKYTIIQFVKYTHFIIYPENYKIIFIFHFYIKKMFNYDLNYMQSLSWNKYIGCRNILSTFLKFSTLCARSLCNPTHFLGKSNYEKRKKI